MTCALSRRFAKGEPPARALALGLAVAAALVADVAHAQTAAPAEVCASSHFEAQRLRRDRSLRAALRALSRCSEAACPAMIRDECVGWQREVADDLPTIVPSWEGRELADVRVLFDGQLIAERLEGKALTVDPGEHVVRFEPRGGPPVERRVVLRERERARVDAGPEPPPPTTAATADDERGGVPAGVWALGAVGAAGLATFTVFGIAGRVQKSDLDTCRPSCPADDVDAAQRSYLIGDVGLLVGAVAIGAGVALYVGSRPDDPRPARQVRLETQTARGGLGAGIAGEF